MKEYIAVNGDLSIRRLNDTDEELIMLGNWRDDERVSKYYGGRDKDNSLSALKEKYLDRIHGKSLIKPCIIEYLHKPSGYIQYYEFNEKKYKDHDLTAYNNAYGIDIFIAPDAGHSKGLGSKSLKLMCSYLFNTLNADIIEICPRSVNERAVRAYEKAGFKPYKRLKKGEFFEGEWFEEIVMIMTK